MFVQSLGAGSPPPPPTIIRYSYVGPSNILTGHGYIDANDLYLVQATPIINGEALQLYIRQMAATVAGIHVKGVIYSDNAGVPGNLLYTTEEYTTVASAFDVDIGLAFASAPVMTNGTPYWIGYIADGAFHSESSGASNTGYALATSYASGPPASAAGALLTAPILCYIAYGDSTTETGTGFISTVGQNIPLGADSKNRLSLPADRVTNDIIFVHVSYTAVSGVATFPTPVGYTKVLDTSIVLSDWRKVIFMKRLDGTEGILQINWQNSNLSSINVNVSLWRGYLAVGTPYESVGGVSSGTSATAICGAITTLGANRTILNFFSTAQNDTTPGPAGSGYTRAYSLSGPPSFEVPVNSTLDYKDMAVAGSSGGESISVPGSPRWRGDALALIYA